jgi:hypothetical protein
MKNVTLDLYVLTPLNIRYYVPDFDLIMSPTSPIPLKERVDLLYAHIIETYGGLCISPGTIVHNLQPLLDKTLNYDIVTVGSDPHIMNNYNNRLYPNNYIIGGKKDSAVFTNYRTRLSQSVNIDLPLNKPSTTILSDVLHEINEEDHFHFNVDYDGTHDSNMKTLTLGDYLGTQKITFKNKPFIITFPYEQLSTNLEYRWFRKLSSYDFKHSNLEIKRLVLSQ